MIRKGNILTAISPRAAGICFCQNFCDCQVSSLYSWDLGQGKMSDGSVLYRFITQLSAWLLHTTDTSPGLDQQKKETKNIFTDFVKEKMKKSLINAMKIKVEKGTSWGNAFRSLIKMIMGFFNSFLSCSLETDYFCSVVKTIDRRGEFLQWSGTTKYWFYCLLTFYCSLFVGFKDLQKTGKMLLS